MLNQNTSQQNSSLLFLQQVSLIQHTECHHCQHQPTKKIIEGRPSIYAVTTFTTTFGQKRRLAGRAEQILPT